MRISMRVVAFVMLVAFFSAACAAPVYRSVPAYPARGQSPVEMSRDIAECEVWARQQTGYDPAMDTLKGGAIGAVIGAIGGAAAGAAIGAATDNPGQGAAIGAAAGGIGGAGIGGGIGYTKSRDGYERAYTACMLTRGYSVGGNLPVPPAPLPPVFRTPPPPSGYVPPGAGSVCVGKMVYSDGRYFCSGQLFP